MQLLNLDAEVRMMSFRIRNIKLPANLSKDVSVISPAVVYGVLSCFQKLSLAMTTSVIIGSDFLKSFGDFHCMLWKSYTFIPVNKGQEEDED
ncbi:hypothetical protein MKW98_018111 [Papaver atlanticum]|uniref:Uncharacterized protein n=1 Tax=Papaver atlanticum TaxID=357466 RepID=A0AAD4SAY0_9MAGN|nr:hypothetical protein MKW98_018111 [Papaver atlanticum]